MSPGGLWSRWLGSQRGPAARALGRQRIRAGLVRPPQRASQRGRAAVRRCGGNRYSSTGAGVAAPGAHWEQRSHFQCRQRRAAGLPLGRSTHRSRRSRPQTRSKRRLWRRLGVAASSGVIGTLAQTSALVVRFVLAASRQASHPRSSLPCADPITPIDSRSQEEKHKAHHDRERPDHVVQRNAAGLPERNRSGVIPERWPRRQNSFQSFRQSLTRQEETHHRCNAGSSSGSKGGQACPFNADRLRLWER